MPSSLEDATRKLRSQFPSSLVGRASRDRSCPPSPARTLVFSPILQPFPPPSQFLPPPSFVRFFFRKRLFSKDESLIPPPPIFSSVPPPPFRQRLVDSSSPFLLAFPLFLGGKGGTKFSLSPNCFFPPPFGIRCSSPLYGESISLFLPPGRLPFTPARRARKPFLSRIISPCASYIVLSSFFPFLRVIDKLFGFPDVRRSSCEE